MAIIRGEAATAVAIAVFVLFAVYGHLVTPSDIGVLPSFLILALLFLVMLWAAFNVVRHAECLATWLGEP